MEFNELLDFVSSEDERLIKFKGASSSLRERVLSRTVKLGEEFGELCNEVIGFNKNHRNDKQSRFTQESLEGEFADVIIVTLLLAKMLDVDIEKALVNKIDKIKSRVY